jgi:hypothetical protein
MKKKGKKSYPTESPSKYIGKDNSGAWDIDTSAWEEKLPTWEAPQIDWDIDTSAWGIDSEE